MIANDAKAKRADGPRRRLHNGDYECAAAMLKRAIHSSRMRFAFVLLLMNVAPPLPAAFAVDGDGATFLMQQASGTSRNPALSDTGTRLTFESAGNLTGGGMVGIQQIYFRDANGGLVQVSRGQGTSSNSSLSRTGSLIVFQSTSDPANGAFRLGFVESAIQCQLEKFALPDILQSVVTQFLERTLDGLALGIQNAPLQRNVYVSFHEG